VTGEREQLLGLIRGYRISQSIYVATQLGVPDLLFGGPRDVDDLARETARVVAAAYDCSRLRRVIDVGGGRGRLVATVLERNPGLHGVLFDRPQVVGEAKALLGDAGVLDRCELVEGDFFERVPAGGDLYVLRNIIHDWRDAEAVAILAACRRAMSAEARLVLVERYVPDDPREAFGVLQSDLEMLVNVGGQERTTDEYAALLERAGLTLTRTIALPRVPEAMGHYLVEAVA
jgi:hypothetical protein